MERFKKWELKVALGEDYAGKYPVRGDTRKTFRKYLNVLETRGKELRREKDARDATHAAEKDARDATLAAEKDAREALERAEELKLQEMRLAQDV